MSEPTKPRIGNAKERLRAAADDARTIATAVALLVIDRFPIIGAAARRNRRAVVLEPYVRTGTLAGSLLKLAAVPLLPLFCIIYGFFFGLTAPWWIVQFAAPIAVLAGAVIWALPDMKRAPTFGIELLFPVFFIVLVLWPGYLAIALPGLPWITMLRLVGFPMAGLLLVCLSVSERFRAEVRDSLNGFKPLTVFFFGFVLIEILTIPLSDNPVSSAQLVFTHQVNWTSVFIIGCVMFRDMRYVERYLTLLVCLMIPIIALTTFETYRQHVPWTAHIPPFLKVPDEVVERVLRVQFRLFLNRYRAKATFFTALSLAEFLSLLTPFLLYFGLSRINLFLKVGALALVPATFMAVRFTDSRLGVVGMLASVVLYGFLWSLVRWRANRKDVLAAGMVYGYPAVAALFMAAFLASGRLRAMALGGGAQASSNEARETQLVMAFDALTRRPVGYGAGQAGQSLGFAPGEFITVDNYFITVSMDYGLLGAIFWYGIFITAIVVAVRACLDPKTGGRPEARLMAPLAVSLTAFLIVKWVHGQDANHPIFFLMVAMISGLKWRLNAYPDWDGTSPLPPPARRSVP
jgi:hypothetical protein